MVKVEINSNLEPSYETNSIELMKNISHTILSTLQPPKNSSISMNLETIEEPRKIKIYEGLKKKNGLSSLKNVRMHLHGFTKS